MYVYCRQSYNALKPACVFPIEVQLQLEETSVSCEEGEVNTLTLVDEQKPIIDLPSEEKGKDEDEDLISI